MPKSHAVIAVLALAMVPGASSRAQEDSALAARIERITSRPEFERALWGIEFYDADADRVIFAQNAGKLFTPGSTTKLLSAGTALAMLGADHRFHTRVYRTGPIGRDGTLAGDLVLVASGDPNLSQRLQPDGTLAFENHDHSYGGAPDTRAVPGDPLTVVRRLAGQIVAKGIKRVTGVVRVDASLYAEGSRELGTGVVVSPISINDNVIDITVGPGATTGAAATLVVSPASTFIRVVNRVTTIAAGGNASITIDDGGAKGDSPFTVTIAGVVPMGTDGVLYAYPVPVPSRYAAHVLAEALRSKGVVVRAGPSDARVRAARSSGRYRPGDVVAEHVSAPATEMIKVVLKVSQNLHASSLPLLMGALFGKDGENGFDVERRWLEREGLGLDGAQQADGAGGDAHFSPAFMVSYLRMMSKRADYPSFQNALPVLGKDGTLYNIQPQSPAAGHVFAKTGTYAVDDPLNRRLLVTGKGLAGYMTTKTGKRLILAIYVNNVPVSTAPDEITRVVGQALGEIAAAAWEYR